MEIPGYRVQAQHIEKGPSAFCLAVSGAQKSSRVCIGCDEW